MSEFAKKDLNQFNKKLTLTAMRRLHLSFKKLHFLHHLLYLTEFMVFLTLTHFSPVSRFYTP